MRVGLVPLWALRRRVEEAAEAEGVDAMLLRAVIVVESGDWRAVANGADPVVSVTVTRYEPQYRWLWDPIRRKPTRNPAALDPTELAGQRTSWGVCQVMGAVAREYGYRGPWGGLIDVAFSIPRLPGSIPYGARHLARLVERFGREGGVAAYNAGPGGIDSDRAGWYRERVEAVYAALTRGDGAEGVPVAEGG